MESRRFEPISNSRIRELHEVFDGFRHNRAKESNDDSTQRLRTVFDVKIHLEFEQLNNIILYL